LTTGEGGMIIVRNEKDAEWLRSMRAFGTNTSPLERDRANYLLKENFDKIGSNHKMSDISAAVGLAHLSYIDEEIELRKQAALYYDKLLTENYLSQGKVELATVIPDYCTKCNYQNYHIILDWVYMRDSIVDSLRKKEIGSKWDIQCTHLEPSINSKEKLEQSEKFHKRGMWLPFFAEITRDQQDIVVQNLKTILHESHQSM
jgi:dTDP-4-amino-4,6-dideoxygalactose transaminase